MRAARTAAAAAALAMLTAAAPPRERLGSSFAMLAQPGAAAESGAIRLARPHRTLVELQVRPAAAVALGGSVPADLAVQFGAKQDIPFVRGMQLYGWPERPGLYCDLLRHRGLGLSAACLNDSDRDGRFDEGLRLDFNSGHADLLLISPSGKIIGANFTRARVPLPQPVPYSAAAPAPGVTGKLALRWKPVPAKASPTPAAQLWISTPDNYTGTEGLSEKVLVFHRGKAPLDVELYGVRLRIHGFDEKGAMKYSVLQVAEGAAVPLLFRGYTFRIMFV